MAPPAPAVEGGQAPQGRQQQPQGGFGLSGIIRMAVFWYFASKFFSPKKPTEPSALISNLFQKAQPLVLSLSPSHIRTLSLSPLLTQLLLHDLTSIKLLLLFLWIRLSSECRLVIYTISMILLGYDLSLNGISISSYGVMMVRDSFVHDRKSQNKLLLLKNEIRFLCNYHNLTSLCSDFCASCKEFPSWCCLLFLCSV